MIRLGPADDQHAQFLGGLRGLDPSRTARRWPVRWKPEINAFAITFDDRRPAAETSGSTTSETPFAR